MLAIDPHAPIRVARPTRDLEAIERFWVDGVGLARLWHTDGHLAEDGTLSHALTMVGVPGAGWHIELVADTEAYVAPGEEDILVVYLGEAPADEWITQIEAAGGQRVAARNPYWDRWGVMMIDPDGYRFVLSWREWR